MSEHEMRVMRPGDTESDAAPSPTLVTSGSTVEMLAQSSAARADNHHPVYDPVLNAGGGARDAAPSASAAAAAARRWRVVAIVLLVLLIVFAAAAIALAVSFGVIAVRDAATIANQQATLRGPCAGAAATASVSFPPRTAAVFDPFTASELEAIGAYVRAQLSLADAEPENMRANWLYGIDFLPENKTTVLGYLDGSVSAYAGRSARAIVFYLAEATAPRVVEYRVGPIASFPVPAGTPLVPIEQGGTLGTATEIPYLMRPISAMEYKLMEPLVVDAMTTLANLSTTSYGELYDDGNMWWTDSAPRGYTRAQRQTWIWFMWYTEGMYVVPIGLQMLINHTSLNSSDWSIIELAYNGLGPFASASALATQFNGGTLAVLNYPRPTTANWTTDPVWSSMRRRGAARALEQRAVPVAVQQGGARFAVSGSQVHWLGWDVHLSFAIVGGTVLSDIRFRGERIVYELSLQDAYAAYSGGMPLQALSQYSDAGWGMGYSNFMLMPGVDCPVFARMFNTTYYVDGALHTNINSVCVWEQPEDIAIMRHYDRNFVDGTGFMFASGYPRTVLVVRTTSTVYNYDYYYSYLFHMDGTIQVSTIASGYLQADVYPSAVSAQQRETPFANRVHTHTIGSLHDHLFGYKVDLDVLGVNNSLMRNNIKVGTFAQPWNFGGTSNLYKYVERTMVAAEGANSLYNVDPAQPAMFMFMNHNATNGGRNAWGVARGYGIHIPGSAVQLLNGSAPFMNAEQWTKYNIAVLRRHDYEQRSCRVLYDMQAPAEPLVLFDSYINGESLVEQDLVAWVMIGTMHMPTSEDAPVTTTPGTAASFFIRPMNYFDESPVTDLTRTYFKTGTLLPGSEALDADTTNVASSERCFEAADAWAFA